MSSNLRSVALAGALAGLSLCLFAGSSPAAAAPAAPPPSAATQDWAAALRQDATAFHALVQTSHPGPRDGENPGFSAVLEREYARAMERARTATSYSHFYWALQAFANAFDDGHLGIADAKPAEAMSLDYEWPGFVTALRDGAPRVVASSAADAPPLGATLLSCDGVAAEALAARQLGAVYGRWTLAARREQMAPRLFLRARNPYLPRPARCRFAAAGGEKDYALHWTALTQAQRTEALAAAAEPRFNAPVGLETFAAGGAGPGGVWVSLGSFDSDPASKTGRQLTALQAQVEARADELRRAPVLVFDLRGNNGGSSAWSTAIARTLWGQAYLQAHAPRDAGVDWRVSDGNIAQLETYRAKYSQPESRNPRSLAWATEVLAGLQQARAAGADLWRQGDAAVPAATAPPAGPDLVTGRVYVLTDGGCASACLDAVDTFTSLGAVQVGRETGADTLYMDIRMAPLPSGWSIAYVPMKVYRGRPRGSNVPATPRHLWTGRMGDTAGLRTWILGL